MAWCGAVRGGVHESYEQVPECLRSRFSFDLRTSLEVSSKLNVAKPWLGGHLRTDGEVGLASMNALPSAFRTATHSTNWPYKKKKRVIYLVL